MAARSSSLKTSQGDGVGTVLHDRAHAVAPEEVTPEVQGKVTEEVAVIRAEVVVDQLVEVAVARFITLPMTARVARLTTAHMFHAMAALVTPPMTVHVVRLVTAHVFHPTTAHVI